MHKCSINYTMRANTVVLARNSMQSKTVMLFHYNKTSCGYNKAQAAAWLADGALCSSSPQRPSCRGKPLISCRSGSAKADKRCVIRSTSTGLKVDSKTAESLTSSPYRSARVSAAFCAAALRSSAGLCAATQMSTVSLQLRSGLVHESDKSTRQLRMSE